MDSPTTQAWSVLFQPGFILARQESSSSPAVQARRHQVPLVNGKQYTIKPIALSCALRNVDHRNGLHTRNVLKHPTEKSCVGLNQI
jgi:hypothetical protein